MPEPQKPQKPSGAAPASGGGPIAPASCSSTGGSCGCDSTAPKVAGTAPPSRRNFLWAGLRGGFLFALGAVTALIFRRSQRERTVWQIDPNKCIACSNCATNCVLQPSAVKCVQHYEMCGYCRLCTGYFEPEPNALNTAAENQVCPTGAIERKALEDPYFEYNILEPLCIGCGKCVVGCVIFGNGSFALQVRHDRCVNCNECNIAIHCPADAFVRVPASQPYLLKTRPAKAEPAAT